VLAPEVGGEAREIEVPAAHLLDQPVPLLLVRQIVRVGIAVEAAELEAVEAQLVQLGADRIEGDRVLRVRADVVGPGADRDPTHRALPA
jgi:hypothetical protein